MIQWLRSQCPANGVNPFTPPLKEIETQLAFANNLASTMTQFDSTNAPLCTVTYSNLGVINAKIAAFGTLKVVGDPMLTSHPPPTALHCTAVAGWRSPDHRVRACACAHGHTGCASGGAHRG
jgi:hypothetical protein